MKLNLTPSLKHIALSALLLIFFSSLLFAQENYKHFQEEVNQIIANTPIPNDQSPVYLFTGSSSIRLWKDINEYFPGQTIVNTGFGGSQTHELLYFSDELILRYKPHKIFIYEGDNDLASGKNPITIFNTMKKLVTKIQTNLPEVEIVLLSPKPSPSRWELKEKYETLNRLLEVYGKKTPKVEFVDLWNITLDEKGTPMKDIFKEDRLHLNKKGYDIWAKAIKEHIP